MESEALSAIENAGTLGIEQSLLFAGKAGGRHALILTNTLAKMRRDGTVVLRRETRDGVQVGIYYSAENAPVVGGGE